MIKKVLVVMLSVALLTEPLLAKGGGGMGRGYGGGSRTAPAPKSAPVVKSSPKSIPTKQTGGTSRTKSTPPSFFRSPLGFMWFYILFILPHYSSADKEKHNG